MNLGGKMKRTYFYIFEYISTFVICILLELFFIFVFQKPNSIFDYFLYIFFGIGWIAVFFHGASYCESEITGNGILEKQRKKFSELAAIEKASGQINTIRLFFFEDTSRRFYSQKPIFIKYTLQKKQLVRMIEKIEEENHDVKFICKGIVVKKEKFVGQL